MDRPFVRLTFFLLVLSTGLSNLGYAQDRVHLRWVRSKPIIDSIVISGNESFSDGQIKKQMYSRVHSLWGAIKGDRRTRIQRETVSRDTLEIKYLYLTNGFLDVQVIEDFEIIEPDSTALVRVNIVEDRQLFYGDKNLVGSFPEGFAYDFRNIAERLKKNKPISLVELETTTFDMKTVLANRGYPYATVIYELNRGEANTTTNITFRIESDSLVRFGELSILGIDKFDESVAQREVKLRPGDIYRRKTILDSQRRLFESGYFSTLQLYQAEEGGDRLQPDFVLRVRERKPSYITITTGAGQSQYKDLIWDVSGGFGKRNFLGSRRYDIMADYSFGLGEHSRLVTHRYRLRYTEPWFIGIRMPMLFTGEYEPRMKDPVQDYRIESWSVSVATLKRFGEKIRTNLGLEYESVKISGVPSELAEIIKEENRISVRRKLYFSFRRDSRFNIFIPRRGSVSELIGEYNGGFLGGDEHFTRLEASWARYQVIWPGWVLATRLKVGWAEGHSSADEVPISDRLYLGGANTVRGFRENSLGPLGEDDAPHGANFIAIFNQEFRWRTLQVFQVIPLLNDLFRNFPLWQSVFFDVGNGFVKPTEFRFTQLALSYGTGVQIVSPAGPIRIDYARRVKTERYGYDDRWHFTILYAF